MTISSLDTRAAAREAYVSRARAKFAVLLSGQAYEALTWNVSALKRVASERAQRLYWTETGSDAVPLPAAYADAVKAWVVIAGGTASRMHQRVTAARWLWAGIAQRLGPDGGHHFAWEDLRAEDLRAAEQLLIASGAMPRSVNKAMVTAADCVRHLGIAGIAPAIVYNPVTPRGTDSNVHKVGGDPSAREEGVLTPAANAALADIFHRGTEYRDALWSSVLAICIGAGLRINEALSLPLDCLAEEPLRARGVTGTWITRRQVYLLRHKSKSQRAGGAGRRSLERVPLTDAQAALVRLAVERLTRLCANARVVAARLEATAPHWTAPIRTPDVLYPEDVAAILGCKVTGVTRVFDAVGRPSPAAAAPRSTEAVVYREDLDSYMTRKQDWSALWTVAPTAGRGGQSASASLVCLRMDEGDARRSPLPLIQSASHSMLTNWLAEKPGRENWSVFARMEAEHGVRYREPDGSPVRFTSHACRRLFVTNALVAGATPVDLARWQGRENVGDLRSYDKRSMAEKVAAVRQAITTGRLQGQVTQAYVQLADDVRDGWLEGQVQAMHVTPYGLCVHDFAATPCPLALNCVKGCKDYLHDPSNDEERQVLVQLRRRTQEVVVAMQAEGPVAAGWVREQQETLAGLDHILGQQAPVGGGYIAPYGAGVSRNGASDIQVKA